MLYTLIGVSYCLLQYQAVQSLQKVTFNQLALFVYMFNNYNIVFMKRILFLLISITAISLNGFSQGYRTDHKIKHKGLFEMGYSIGIGDYPANRFEFMASQGLKITPCMFVGIGAGIEYYHKYESTVIPVYCDIRMDILENKNTPFLGMKIGYAFNDIDGIYMSPSVGYKIDSFHFVVGYSLQYVDTKWIEYMNQGVNFKIGYNF